MNVDGEGQTGGVNLAAVAGIAKAKQIMKKGSFKKRKGPKMDTNKALSLMQFTSTREFADRSMGLDPKKELDKKHFTVMMNILKKKKAAVIILTTHFYHFDMLFLKYQNLSSVGERQR